MAFLQQPINATYLQRHSTEVRSHAISSSQGQRKVPCTGGRYTAICHVYPGTELLCKCRLCWCRTIIPCKAKFVLDILYQDANPRFHRQVYDQEYIINRQYCKTLRRHLKTYFRRESLFYMLLVGSLMQARTLPAAFHNLWSYSLRNRYQVLFMKILRMDHNGRVIMSYRRFRFRMRYVKYCPGDADHNTISRNLLLHGKKEETRKMSHLIILFLSFIYWTARVFRCNRTT